MAENQQSKEIQRAAQAATEATNAAYESYARILQRLMRSFRLMEEAANDTNALLNDQIKSLSDSGVIRNLTSMLKKSENLRLKTAGQILESGANLIDTATQLEASMIKAKTSAIQLGASFGQTSEEVQKFANVMLTNIGDLKATLHVQQQEVDKYFNTVKMMAGSYSMMNAQIIDASGNAVEGIHTTLFKFSNAFQYDIVPLTKMVYGAAGRMGASDDPKIAVYKMMSSWTDATKMLRAVGMSTTKGLGDLSSIVAGTEGYVVDGTRRIANIASLYTSVFSILQRKGQEALTERFTRIMDSGLRQLTPQASGLMVVGGFSRGLTGDMRDPLAGGMLIRAAFRAGQDLKTGKTLSTNDMMQMMVSSIEGFAKTPIFAFTPELTQGLSRSQQEEVSKQYMLLDRTLQEFFPESGDLNQRMTLMGILQNWRAGKNISDEDIKKMKKAMGDGLSDAEQIESMKRSTLQQVWDHVSGIYMKAVGMVGGGADIEATKRKSSALFSLSAGAKQHYIDSRIDNFQKENKIERSAAIAALGKQWDDLKRTDALAAVDPIHGSERLAATVQNLSKKYALRLKVTPADRDKLNDPNVTAATKSAIYSKYLGAEIKQDFLSQGITNQEDMDLAQKTLNPWADEAERNQIRATTAGEAQSSPMGGSGRALSAASHEILKGSERTYQQVLEQGIPSGDTEGLTVHGQGQVLRHQAGEVTIGASDMLRIESMGGLNYILSKAKMLSEANLSGGALDELKAEVAGVESGPEGYLAANKQTSATGKYQFLRGTAAELFRKHKAAFASLGVSEQDFSSTTNMRQLMFGAQGAQIQETLMGLAVQDYAKGLRSINVPVTAETLKLVHFMGLGGFKKWIKEGASLDYNPTAGGVKNATVGQYLGLGRKSGAMASAVASQLAVGGFDQWFDFDAGPQEINIDKLIPVLNKAGLATGEQYRLKATIRF